jgi:hypothetical protein
VSRVFAYLGNERNGIVGSRMSLPNGRGYRRVRSWGLTRKWGDAGIRVECLEQTVLGTYLIGGTSPRPSQRRSARLPQICANIGNGTHLVK